MKVIIVNNEEEGAKAAADIVEKAVRENPEGTLGLATGSSPVPLYRELINRCKNGLDFSGIHSVNLDEYIGLEGTNSQSYRYFMNQNLFDGINIDKANTYVPSGIGDIEANLKEFNKVLDESNVMLQVLGVGIDGHLGFNEPGAKLYDKAHIETLDESTIEANSRFFDKKEDVPTKAITQGMGNVMRAKKIVIIISGNKAEAAKQMLNGDYIDPLCPATFLKMHNDVSVIIEKKLADEIGYKG